MKKNFEKKLEMINPFPGDIDDFVPDTPNSPFEGK
jgi:hypothetical protein